MMKNAEKSAIIYINTKWYFLFGCSTIKKERCEVQNQSEEIKPVLLPATVPASCRLERRT